MFSKTAFFDKQQLSFVLDIQKYVTHYYNSSLKFCLRTICTHLIRFLFKNSLPVELTCLLTHNAFITIRGERGARKGNKSNGRYRPTSMEDVSVTVIIRYYQ